MLWAIENPKRVRKLIIVNSIASDEYNFSDKLALSLLLRQYKRRHQAA